MSLGPWESHIIASGAEWAKVVRVACDSVCEEDSDAPDLPDVVPESEGIHSVSCPYCGSCFGQGSGLTSHLRKMHGYTDAWRISI